MIMHGQAPGHAYGVEAGRVVGGLDPALHRVHAGVKVVGPDPKEAEAQRGNQQRRFVASAITKGGNLEERFRWPAFVITIAMRLPTHCYHRCHPRVRLVISAVDGGEGNMHRRFDDFVVVRWHLWLVIYRGSATRGHQICWLTGR